MNGRSGALLDDPKDLEAFGAEVSELLVDEDVARRLGGAARRRVRECFLHDRHLAKWLELLRTVLLEQGAVRGARRTSFAARGTPNQVTQPT